MLDLRNNISVQALFSSTPYQTNGYDRCVYCNKIVENDYFILNGECLCQPYRCVCENAKKELEVKEKLYYQLLELQKNIDKDGLLEEVHNIITQQLNEEYKFLVRDKDSINFLIK